MENNIKETIDKTKDTIKQAKIEHDEKQAIKRKRKFILKVVRSIIAILVLVLLIFVMKLVVDNINADDPVPDVSYTSISQLIDVRDIAELQVANITYNSVATINKQGEITQNVYQDDKEEKKNVERYIAYQGEIIVSYDLDKVKIDKDDVNKVYVVRVPAPKLEPNVFGAEFNHIIIDEKSEKDYDPGKARELCLKDLKVKFNIDRTEIESIANGNMESAINAYLKLFIEEDYKIEYETLREVEE